jgi:hypothetical protein
LILVDRRYLIHTGEEQGHENMTAMVRRVLSLFDPAAGGADRLNSLRTPNQSSFPRSPFPQIVHTCLANPLKFHIPCASPRDVTAPASPLIEQMALS